MERMFHQDDGVCCVEIYEEYLKKIPQLYQQIGTVEKMRRKAEIECKMLDQYDPENNSVKQYRKRLEGILVQTQVRLEDLKDQLQLILSLKKQIEEKLPEVR